MYKDSETLSLQLTHLDTNLAKRTLHIQSLYFMQLECGKILF